MQWAQINFPSELSLMQRFFPLLVFPFLSKTIWWKEPRAQRHFDIVEGNIWHTTPQMLYRKYLQVYKMTFLVFQIFFGTIAHVLKIKCPNACVNTLTNFKSCEDCVVQINPWDFC
jgi:hypothetical protein